MSKQTVLPKIRPLQEQSDLGLKKNCHSMTDQVVKWTLTLKAPIATKVFAFLVY